MSDPRLPALIPPPASGIGELAALLGERMRLGLAYERSRAASPVVALRKFVLGQFREISRLRRLGRHAYFRLARLEAACARSGLGFQALPDVVPWRLPEQLATDPDAPFPAHPLIDGEYLRAALQAGAESFPSAAQALAWLLEARAAEKRWAALGAVGSRLPRREIAVCLHLFYPEVWPEIREALAAIPEEFDLFVTLPDFAFSPALARIAADCPGARFFAYPNRGRDVLPFLRLLRSGVLDPYLAVCKLHTKRSKHMQSGDRWRRGLLGGLLASRERIEELLAGFRGATDMGMAGARSSLVEPGRKLYAGSNASLLNKLADRLLPGAPLSERPFFAGTMFWFRPAAMRRFRDMAIADSDFPLEMGQTDGTPAHVLERLIWPMVEAAGYRVALLEEG